MVDYDAMRRSLMRVDSRNTEDPVPANWASLLTHEQVITINQYSNYGWDLWFIRRPRGEEIVVALKNATTGEVAQVDKEGEFLKNPDLQLRS